MGRVEKQFDIVSVVTPYPIDKTLPVLIKTALN